eukprot:3785123-Rhodomonas_salina.1
MVEGTVLSGRMASLVCAALLNACNNATPPRSPPPFMEAMLSFTEALLSFMEDVLAAVYGAGDALDDLR